MRLNYIDNCDCLDGLAEVPDNSVDLVVADPPYFLSMGHAGSKDTAFAVNTDQVNSNRTFGDLSIAKPFYRQLFQEFHPTQKPVGIIEKMILDSTDPGAVVLDTFMGSGTTAVAALRTGRNYIGFEQDEKYHTIAMQRVAEEVDRLLDVEDDAEKV